MSKCRKARKDRVGHWHLEISTDDCNCAQKIHVHLLLYTCNNKLWTCVILVAGWKELFKGKQFHFWVLQSFINLIYRRYADLEWEENCVMWNFSKLWCLQTLDLHSPGPGGAGWAGLGWTGGGGVESTNCGMSRVCCWGCWIGHFSVVSVDLVGY